MSVINCNLSGLNLSASIHKSRHRKAMHHHLRPMEKLKKRSLVLQSCVLGSLIVAIILGAPATAVSQPGGGPGGGGGGGGAPGQCSCSCPIPYPPPAACNYANDSYYNCPGFPFDSCGCTPISMGTVCGFDTYAMIRHHFDQAGCLACLNAACPCPDPNDPEDSRTPRGASCCPPPEESCAAGSVHCDFDPRVDCGQFCGAFQGFWQWVCNLVNSGVQGGQQNRCLTVSASAGGAGASSTMCCPQGQYITGCGPWNNGGQLDGSCMVIDGSTCAGGAYLCKCPGIHLTCSGGGSVEPTIPPPNGTPPGTPTVIFGGPTATPTATRTPTPTPTGTLPPGPGATPTVAVTRAPVPVRLRQ